MEISNIKYVENQHVLRTIVVETPLGPMVAIANDVGLCLLEFADRQDLGLKIEALKNRAGVMLVPGYNSVLSVIEQELKSYFLGQLQSFKTPILTFGSPFRQNVWQKLQKIPLGATWSYANLAQAIGQPVAYRAVARANGANQLAIIIPCHRVINSNGALGGYNGGLARKMWLLNHEKQMV